LPEHHLAADLDLDQVGISIVFSFAKLGSIFPHPPSRSRELTRTAHHTDGIDGTFEACTQKTATATL
jgi:hypothetical protein